MRLFSSFCSSFKKEIEVPPDLALFLLIDAFNRMNYLFISYWYVNVSWFTFSQLPTARAFGYRKVEGKVLGAIWEDI